MALDDRQLRIVHSVVEWRGVRNAADRLGLDPSVVSRTIAGVEKSTGLALFERHGRSMEPTPAALTLHQFYRESALQQLDLETKLDDLRGLRTGSLTLAVSEGFIESLFEGPLTEFRALYPAVRIQMDHSSVEKIIQLVADSSIDLGLAHNPPPNDGVTVVASAALPFDMIASPEHPLATLRRPVTAQELLAQPLALVSAGYGMRRAVEVFEFTHRVQMRPLLETNALASLKAFAIQNLGVTLLPGKLLKREIQSGRAVALPIDDIIFSRAEGQLLARKGRRLSPAAAEMAKLIVNYMAKL